MNRCVRVQPEDSHLQCILWRDSPQDQLRVFKLDTVTYGTKPASFLAVRAMHQLSADEHAASFGQIRHVSLPRLLRFPNSESEIHGFCDASVEAYGAYVYIVCNGRSQLLCSKSRVVPLKTLTVPKLKLCVAELLSRLIAEVAGTSGF